MSESKYWRIRREKEEKDQEDARRERNEAEHAADRHEIIGALHSGVEKVQAASDQRHSEHEASIRLEWRRLWLDVAGTAGLWAAAAVGLIAIIFSTIDSQKQRDVMQLQLNAMQSQIAITLVQLSPKLELSFVGPENPVTVNGKTGWVFTPKWENHSSVNATLYSGWNDINIIRIPGGSAKLVFPNNPPDVTKTIVTPSGSVLQISKFVSESDVQAAANGNAMIVMWGYIKYASDLPGTKATHVRWCYEAMPTNLDGHYTFSYSQLMQPGCNATY